MAGPAAIRKRNPAQYADRDACNSSAATLCPRLKSACLRGNKFTVMELLLKRYYVYTCCIHRKPSSLWTLVGFDAFLCTVQVQQV